MPAWWCPIFLSYDLLFSSQFFRLGVLQKELQRSRMSSSTQKSVLLIQFLGKTRKKKINKQKQTDEVTTRNQNSLTDWVAEAIFRCIERLFWLSSFWPNPALGVGPVWPDAYLAVLRTKKTISRAVLSVLINARWTYTFILPDAQFRSTVILVSNAKGHWTLEAMARFHQRWLATSKDVLPCSLIHSLDTLSRAS